jgi:hypothetical protein
VLDLTSALLFFQIGLRFGFARGRESACLASAPETVPTNTESYTSSLIEQEPGDPSSRTAPEMDCPTFRGRFRAIGLDVILTSYIKGFEGGLGIYDCMACHARPRVPKIERHFEAWES